VDAYIQLRGIKMKKSLLVTLTAAAISFGTLSGAAFAHEDGKKGPKSSEDRVAKMTEKLDLSAEQKQQLMEIFAKREADRKHMMENTTEEQRENIRKTAREGMKAKMQEEVKSILTDEQKAKYNQMHEKKKGKKGKGKGRDKN